jgi:hypothetical protein
VYSFASQEFASFMLRYPAFRFGTAAFKDPHQYNQSVVLGVDVGAYTDGFRTVTFTSSSAMMHLRLEDGKRVVCDKQFTDFGEVIMEAEAMLGKVQQ